MLYKKQIKRFTKRFIAKNRKHHKISLNSILPVVEKARDKAVKMRINNGQVLISGLEYVTNKNKFILIAQDFMRDECWVIRRKK